MGLSTLLGRVMCSRALQKTFWSQSSRKGRLVASPPNRRRSNLNLGISANATCARENNTKYFTLIVRCVTFSTYCMRAPRVIQSWQSPNALCTYNTSAVHLKLAPALSGHERGSRETHNAQQDLHAHIKWSVRYTAATFIYSNSSHAQGGEMISSTGQQQSIRTSDQDECAGQHAGVWLDVQQF